MNRKELKQKAKYFLGNGRYGKALLITLIIWVLSLGFILSTENNGGYLLGLTGSLINLAIPIKITLNQSIFILLFRLISVVFFIPIFNIALIRYFQLDPDKEELFRDRSIFEGLEGNFWNIIKVYFVMAFVYFAYSIVPIILSTGIIALSGTDAALLMGMAIIIAIAFYLAYKFYMIPYILAEKPYVTFGEARKINDEIIKGERFNLFVLDISFILWIILGLLLPGLDLLISPYILATKTQAYMYYRDKNYVKDDINYSEFYNNFTKEDAEEYR